jgi:hypothetical protein
VVDVPEKTIGREKPSRVHLWIVPAQVHGLWCAPGVRLEVAQRFQPFSATLTEGAAPAPLLVFDGRIAGRELAGGVQAQMRLTATADGLRLEPSALPGGVHAGRTFSRGGPRGCEWACPGAARSRDGPGAKVVAVLPGAGALQTQPVAPMPAPSATSHSGLILERSITVIVEASSASATSVRASRVRTNGSASSQPVENSSPTVSGARPATMARTLRASRCSRVQRGPPEEVPGARLRCLSRAGRRETPCHGLQPQAAARLTLRAVSARRCRRQGRP